MSLQVCAVLTGLLQSEPSPLRQNLPGLMRLSEEGTIYRLNPEQNVLCEEALWLGMPPTVGQLAPGPLTVSWLGHDPPERSTHFCLELLSAVDGVARQPVSIKPGESAELKRLMPRLNSKGLTNLFGESFQHALVWEDWGEFRLTAPQDLLDKQITGYLPEGDAEKLLRRLVDDSVNLLSEQEFNKIREDEGELPLNLLWPWGHGRREAVPNLALRRGQPVQVLTDGPRMMGLARLAGYRSRGKEAFKRGLNADWEALLAQVKSVNWPSLLFTDIWDRLNALDREEERHWLLSEWDRRFLQPLLAGELQKLSAFTMVVPGDRNAPGLALDWQPRGQGSRVPLDERALEERTVPTRNAWELIQASLTSKTNLG